MVVLFSDGFITEIGRLTGAAEAHELQELIDMALHSGIILNAVSIRGITAEGIISNQDFSLRHPSLRSPSAQNNDSRNRHKNSTTKRKSNG